MATISGLSRIASWRGKTDEALRLQAEALSGFRDLGADDLVVDSLVRIVEIHVIAGDWSAALTASEEATKALARHGDVAVIPATLARLTARALILAGREGEARTLFERAIDLANRDGSTYEVALASLGIGRLNCDDSRVAHALAQLGELGVVAPPPGS